jgi:hypothetical protein
MQVILNERLSHILAPFQGFMFGFSIYTGLTPGAIVLSPFQGLMHPGFIVNGGDMYVKL